MRNGKLLKLAQALGLAFALLLLIALPEAAAGAAQDGLALCAKVVLPSLFPFFVCSQLFLQLGFAARLSRLLARPVSRLLRLPVQAGSAFLLGVWPGRGRSARLPSAIRRGRRSFSAFSAALCLGARQPGRFSMVCSFCPPSSFAV